jgi:hypothetical protein
MRERETPLLASSSSSDLQRTMRDPLSVLTTCLKTNVVIVDEIKEKKKKTTICFSGSSGLPSRQMSALKTIIDEAPPPAAPYTIATHSSCLNKFESFDPLGRLLFI